MEHCSLEVIKQTSFYKSAVGLGQSGLGLGYTGMQVFELTATGTKDQSHLLSFEPSQPVIHLNLLFENGFLFHTF